MKVTVYYNPDDPSVGVLTPEMPPVHLWLLIAVIGITVVSAVTSYFTVRGWLKGKKAPAG